jgi:hypothetical protein
LPEQVDIDEAKERIQENLAKFLEDYTVGNPRYSHQSLDLFEEQFEARLLHPCRVEWDPEDETRALITWGLVEFRFPDHETLRSIPLVGIVDMEHALPY